ncbi:MAG: ribonuclease G [Pseudomonadota bacterium]
MAQEILVNVTPHETRVAAIENGVLQEVSIERERSRGLVGNIYMGKVSRVLPGMGAAFLEVGLERTAFLHANDIARPNGSEDNDEVQPTITDLIEEGQQLPVQVTKDPLGTKGARLTTQISIPSRYLVFMPESNAIGISQRIENEEERTRLESIVTSLAPGLSSMTEMVETIDMSTFQSQLRGEGGYIIRTAAEGATVDAIQRDMSFLQRLWESLQQRLSTAAAPALIYEDLPLVLRSIRDISVDATERVLIDSQETLEHVSEFVKEFTPELLPKVQHYPGERPILDLYSAEDEIDRALQSKVDLKSGGYLIVDQTEAMTTIDVNTGGFVGHRNLEETIFKTNLEATHAIARQLRLRNLGGIVIIDFIDMLDAEHQRQVLRALEKAFEKDHSKIAISELTSLGLVQVTRKRTRESLEHVLCEPCATCNGRGSVKTVETVCFEIFREILREQKQFDAQKLLVVASQEVVDQLLHEENASVAELERFIGTPIQFQAENSYNQQQYDIVIL